MKRLLRALCGLALAGVLPAGPVGAAEVKVEKPYFRWLFGGFGFQHSEANFEALMTDEFRDQRVLKTFAEISPTFGRVYTGFADQSTEQMDRFAAYYRKTFARAGTTLYAVPGALKYRAEDDAVTPTDYAARVAKSLVYLMRTKDCRNLRYYCLSNELMSGDRWGWFDRADRMDLFKSWTVALYDAFRREGLDLLLLGSDKSLPNKLEDGLAVQQWCADNMDDWLGAYVTHWYVYNRPVSDLGLWDVYRKHFDSEVKIALKKSKRYILGEFGFCPVWGTPGVMVDDVGPWKRQPATVAEAALCKCEVGLAAMNAGAYGCISWSFVDYPDPFPCSDGHAPIDRARYEAGLCAYRPDLKYNKWGLFRWNDVDRDYSASPELYVLGHLARLFRKGATVLTCASDDPAVRAGAVLNPDRTFSVALVNRGEARDATVDCASWFGKAAAEPRAVLRRYAYEAAHVPDNPFNDLQSWDGTVALQEGRVRVRLPAKSFTILTTDYVARTPPAVVGVCRTGSLLSWSPAADPEHRYYRVYADGRQIASTVATHCAVPPAAPSAYTVRSVDRWGNVSEALEPSTPLRNP